LNCQIKALDNGIPDDFTQENGFSYTIFGLRGKVSRVGRNLLQKENAKGGQVYPVTKGQWDMSLQSMWLEHLNLCHSYGGLGGEKEEEKEGLFKVDAVNEEDSEPDHATLV